MSSCTIVEAAESETTSFDSDIWASEGGFGREISIGALIFGSIHWSGIRGLENSSRFVRRREMYKMESEWSGGVEIGGRNLPEGAETMGVFVWENRREKYTIDRNFSVRMWRLNLSRLCLNLG